MVDAVVIGKKVLRLEILVAQTDVYGTEMRLDTFISVTTNSGWRE